jgi:adenine/guanine phosphoribosyltransferase-like PRPP-binding protein
MEASEYPKPPKPRFKHCDYLRNFIVPERLEERVKLAARALKYHEFDAIAFRGMSGALISVPLALKMCKTMIMVRKPGDDSHSTFLVEGDTQARKYVIVDDFVATGDTVRTIKREVVKFSPDSECIGVLPVNEIETEEFKKNKYGINNLYPLWNNWKSKYD